MGGGVADELLAGELFPDELPANEFVVRALFIEALFVVAGFAGAALAVAGDDDIDAGDGSTIGNGPEATRGAACVSAGVAVVALGTLSAGCG